MKEKGVDENSSLALINQCINEVLELECARSKLKREEKMKSFSKSFCEQKTLTKSFSCLKD